MQGKVSESNEFTEQDTTKALQMKRRLSRMECHDRLSLNPSQS